MYDKDTLLRVSLSKNSPSIKELNYPNGHQEEGKW